MELQIETEGISQFMHYFSLFKCDQICLKA